MTNPIDGDELIKWIETMLLKCEMAKTKEADIQYLLLKGFRSKILSLQSQAKSEQEEKVYKWVKRTVKTDEVPPINEEVIFRENGEITSDSTISGWDANVCGYEWLKEIPLPVSPPKMTIEECKDKVARKHKFLYWNDVVKKTFGSTRFVELKNEAYEMYEAMELYRKQ